MNENYSECGWGGLVFKRTKIETKRGGEGRGREGNRWEILQRQKFERKEKLGHGSSLSFQLEPC
jgi:hypothetical protein